MRGKYTPRYLSSDEKNQKTKRPIITVVCIVVVLCTALLAAVIWLRGDENPEKAGGTEATQAQQGAEQTTPDGYKAIQTAYCPLLISSDHFDDFRHMEVSQDGVTMEVFYMLLENGEWELFRIYFGDAGMGEEIGSFQTENGAIPVSIAVCAYNEEEFASDELYQKYHTLMGQLDTVLTSLRSDSRFVAAGEGEATEAPQKVGLTYWDVELPASMEWEEMTFGDVYQVDFYGDINGEKILLYSLYLGDVNAESVVGVYTVDGVEKDLSAITCSLEMQIPDADDETKAEFYKLMRTINDVLQVIMASENFFEKVSE